MVAQTDLAWRLLQIIALALPAMAILLQVLTQMDRDDADNSPLHVLISSSMLFLIGPMAVAGILSAFVIINSYEELWLKSAVFLTAIPFLVLPIILYSIYRSTSLDYKERFLPHEKEAIEKAVEAGDMENPDAARKLEIIEAQRGGIVAQYIFLTGKIDRFFDRHPVFSLIYHIFAMVIGAYLVLETQGILLTLTGGLVALYSALMIIIHFIDFPEEVAQ